MSTRILSGDCRASMRGLPAGSVQAVITSPPYYGQRAYGTQPQVWGGAADCRHRFEMVRTKRGNGGGGTGRASQKQNTNVGAFVTDTKDRATYAETCGRCGAVRCELGLEPDPLLYVAHLVEVFTEVWRVLRDDGVVFLNLGDAFNNAGSCRNGEGLDEKRRGGATGPTGELGYQKRDNRHAWRHLGIKHKDLMLLPHRTAIALQEAGWIVRCDCVWAPSNAMPESARDRPTLTHEYVFVLTKRTSYFWDRDAVLTPYATSTRPQIGTAYNGNGRRDYTGNGVQDPSDAKRSMVAGLEKNGGANLRSVWWFPTGGVDVRKFGITDAEHYASFPEEMARIAISAATSEAGACRKCGKAWVRVTERQERNLSNAAKAGTRIQGKGHPSSQVREGHDIRNGPCPLIQTLGWQPACKCPDPGPPVPCCVLDPFAGTGTVSAVATKLGRDSIACEAQPDYVRIIEARVRYEEGLFGTVAEPETAEEPAPVLQEALPW